jgi:hypothetical protein
VITIGGRFGSLHEFTTALESHMPCGVLLGSGGTADIIPELMERLEPINRDMVIFDDDPERLVKRVIEMLNEDYADINTKTLSDQWFLSHPHKHNG